MLKKSKLSLTALFVMLLLTLSGCATSPHKDYSWQGKVQRAYITKTLWGYDVSHVVMQVPEGPTHFTPQKNGNMRMTFVVMTQGAVFKDYVGSNLFVPDNIEFADLQKGAIVEVVHERGDAFDFNANKFSRVIHLVCKADDKPCLERESKSSLMHYVVDKNPKEYEAKYHNTYLRQTAVEDRIKFADEQQLAALRKKGQVP